MMQKDVQVLDDAEMFIKYGWSWVRAERTLRKFREDMKPRRTIKPVITWLWGDTGCGKSWFAFEHAYLKDHKHGVLMMGNGGNNMWLDDCQHSKVVVIDDWCPGDVPWTMMTKLLDRYPCNAPVKSSNVKILWEHVYVTSNFHPKDIYIKKEYNPDCPFHRRLTTGGSKVINMTEKWKEPPILLEIRAGLYPDKQDTAEVPRIEGPYADIHPTEYDSDISLD